MILKSNLDKHFLNDHFLINKYNMLCAMTQSTKNAEIQEKFIFYVVTKTERMVA